MSRLTHTPDNNGRFVTQVLSVHRVLTTIGICAALGLAIRITSQLAVITHRLDTLQINYEDAKVTMKALEFITNRITDNYSNVTKEFADLRSRLRELEDAERN